MKYHIITIGCQMNKSDSERIAGNLEIFGFSEAADYKVADLVILTTCGVRQSAEDRIYGLIPRIRKENPDVKIILTGCLSQREDVLRRLDGVVDYFMPISELLNLPDIIENLIKENKKTSKQKNNAVAISRDSEISAASESPGGDSDGKRYEDYLQVKAKYSSSFSAFVPIGNGCDNFCSYCVVPYARGREKYRPAEEIIAEVKDLVERGYKEITLIAQNVNSYISPRPSDTPLLIRRGERGEVNFAELLRMINDIKGKFWIRFTTSHPKDMSDELIQVIAECKKVCEHVHLPAQAGDNEIIKQMNRKYTREDYLVLINKIRDNINIKTQEELEFKLPVSITTDIIVGFPGETEEHFNNTLKLFEEVGFDMAYIAQYSPRPGTAAAKFVDDVTKEEKKRREEALMTILRKTALKNNQEYLDQIVKVLIDDKNKKGEWLGKTRTGKVIRIKDSSDKVKIGDFRNVRVKNVQDFGLEGESVF